MCGRGLAYHTHTPSSIQLQHIPPTILFPLSGLLDLFSHLGGESDSGAIAGGVIGGVVAAILLALLLLVVCCCCWKHAYCCCAAGGKEEEADIGQSLHMCCSQDTISEGGGA